MASAAEAQEEGGELVVTAMNDWAPLGATRVEGPPPAGHWVVYQGEIVKVVQVLTGAAAVTGVRCPVAPDTPGVYQVTLQMRPGHTRNVWQGESSWWWCYDNPHYPVCARCRGPVPCLAW